MYHKLIICIGLVAALEYTASANPTLTLPFDGVAQGHDLTVPVTLHATNGLAGLQCDVIYDSSRLVCSNAPELVSGPTGVIVDGAMMKPGQYRLLAYSPNGSALTNNVVCNVTFTAPTNAPNGQAPLGPGNSIFVNANTLTMSGEVSSGLVLVGDAFGFVPGGGRAQFRGAEGANYIIKASADMTSWMPLVTNTSTKELVWTVDTNALVSSKQFYKSVPAP